MQLHPPLVITPRLLPGLRVGDAFVSVEWSSRPGRGGRARCRYYIDDLQTGAGGGRLDECLASLLSFLTACVESRDYADRTGREGENADLFPENVGQWAQENRSELDSALCDLTDDTGAVRQNLMTE